MCAEMNGLDVYRRPGLGIVEALVINSLTDGLWVALGHDPIRFSRAQALEALHASLAAFYPHHFTLDGPVD
jgi:hypothetical protein